MIPQGILDVASQAGLKSGLKLLQGFRLHPTDNGHVERLLDFIDPAPGSHWLDIGSGFGEFARLARGFRPDLEFTLLNYNQFQLSHSPGDMRRVRADMHALPFASGRFDGALFLYSLCHADDPIGALSEAAGVVRPGGRLIVYDYTGHDGAPASTWGELYARFYPRLVLECMGDAAGWQSLAWEQPHGAEMVFSHHPSFAALHATLWKAARV